MPRWASTTVQIDGPFNVNRPGRHAQPPRDLRLPARLPSRRTRTPCARKILSDARAPRVSPAGHRRATSRRCSAFYRTGRKRTAASRPASSWRSSACSCPRVSCSASSAIRRASRRAPPTASAISSWPRGCRSSCGAASPTTSCSTWRRAGRLTRSGGARAAGAADARRSAVDGARRATSPASGCYLRNMRAVTPDPDAFPEFDDNLREAFQRETELFLDSQLREDRSVARAADGELHVRQRAAGAALRHPERLRQPLPPRDARRRPRAAACSARAAS